MNSPESIRDLLRECQLRDRSKRSPPRRRNPGAAPHVDVERPDVAEAVVCATRRALALGVGHPDVLDRVQRLDVEVRVVGELVGEASRSTAGATARRAR